MEESIYKLTGLRNSRGGSMACSTPTLTILSNGISNCPAVGGWKHQDILREPLIKSPYYEIIGKRKP